MDNKLKIFIGILVLLFVAIIYDDYNKPEPIDWSQTYGLKDKIPFGLYVFDNEFPKMLPQDSIKKIDRTFYEYKESIETIDYLDTITKKDTIKGTIFSIGNNELDDESIDEILNSVSLGNNAFLIADDFSSSLLDTLHLEIDSEMKAPDSLNIWFTNQKNGLTKFTLDNKSNSTYFSKIDTTSTIVLGYQGKNKVKQVNFVKVPFQNGFIYLHTQPIAFTNYYLLKNNTNQYAEKVLSYMPHEKIYWLSKNQNGEEISNSPLSYIKSQPALKYAWRFIIIGLLIFIVFNAKRKQRIVPIKKPLPNTTVDFTKTIGNLYFQEGNHQNIIDKKIVYFLERIRNEYLIDTTILDDAFVKKLHQKTGKNIQDIEHVVRLINYQRKSYNQSIEEDLIELNNAIEKIFS